MARGASILAERPPSGRPVGFGDRPHPDAWAEDLAIQAIGGRSVPVEDLASGSPGGDRLPTVETADPGGGDEPSGSVFCLPAARSRLDRWQAEDLRRWRATASAGSVEIAEPDGDTRLLTQPELAILADAVAGLAEPRQEPPIVVAGSGLRRSPGRAVAAWSVRSGAAVVLPAAGQLLPAFLWARPTVLLAEALEVGLVAAAYGRRRWRRWSRLETVLVFGGEPPLDAVWNRLGVRVLALPEPAQLLAADARR